MNEAATKPANLPPANPGRKKRYDQNFKRAAAELGINAQTLKTWKQQQDVMPPKGAEPTLAQLQAENLRLGASW